MAQPSFTNLQAHREPLAEKSSSRTDKEAAVPGPATVGHVLSLLLPPTHSCFSSALLLAPCPPSLHCHHTHYPTAQALSWRSGIGSNENIWHNCATCTGLIIHWGERDRESLHLFQE